MTFPFLNGSLSLKDRVDEFNRFQESYSAAAREWHSNPEKQPCSGCGLRHPPPCMTQEQRLAHRAALKEGKKLRAEWYSAKKPRPAPPPASPANAARPVNDRLRHVLCPQCANYHAGGAAACRTPSCHACGRHHGRKEACSAAEERFRRRNLIPHEGAGRRDEREPATGGFDSDLFGRLLGLMGNTPKDMQLAKDLFSNMSRKRSADEPAEESAEKADSEEQKKKSKKSDNTGGTNSCQTMKPPPKGPDGPDDEGGKGARRLSGTVYSLRG
ncbi:hypothetical protein B0J11DRAFT_431623 [Dendryphion nanum]|uniref:Uncharacterized protein n=1 Tax=Dendryphion nanum TaxID=256645 RepID=A0A9P9DYE2_9PLEO|nr:hypothetical protein B0J11DRAFT_431623 [Dendryphion nanum]